MESHIVHGEDVQYEEIGDVPGKTNHQVTLENKQFGYYSYVKPAASDSKTGQCDDGYMTPVVTRNVIVRETGQKARGMKDDSLISEEHPYEKLQVVVAADADSKGASSIPIRRVLKRIGIVAVLLVTLVGGILIGLFIGLRVSTGERNTFETTSSGHVRRVPAKPTVPPTTVCPLWCAFLGNKVCQHDGWLVWLRRVDNSVMFNRTWDGYRAGFGDEAGNYWLGLDMLHKITGRGRQYRLRIELQSWSDETAWIEYAYISVGGDTSNYILALGGYDPRSTAPDRLSNLTGQRFTTVDRDNDLLSDKCEGCSVVNCAITYGSGGGWWYRKCSHAYPTALVGGEGYKGSRYVFWLGAFPGNPTLALRSLSMKIKPVPEGQAHKYE